MRTLLQFPGALWRLIVTYLPGPVGHSLRRRYWSKRLKSIGQGGRIDVGVEIVNPGYVSLGDGVWLDRDVTILAGEDKGDREIYRIQNDAYKGNPGEVQIGARTHVAPRVIISGIGAGVYVGSDCAFGAGTCVYSWSNHYGSKESPEDKRFSYSASAPRDRQCILAGPIVFEDNVGVAVNSVILPGVYLPEGCFVLIGGCVRPGEYEKDSVLGGQPARPLFNRFEERAKKE